MALAKPKQDYIQQPYIEQQPAFNPQPKKQQPARRKISIFKWSKAEKLSFVVMMSIIAIFAVMNLNTLSSIQETSVKIGQTEAQIDTIKLENSELSNEVSSLSTPERIMKKAKELGLTSDSKVKVVSGE
ncbi:cell division protein FtsL [Kurthia huakuii]|uniref:cell division protein FtsL n=1 Tax=Kurthia huakuii TaxID=1421019 RepID=UPI000495E29E|nr:septum formation initiator family protein [Kurthia huakuii]MBM7698413.1 cell division protein FtsL [Kurthia huakuii]